MVGPEAPLAAGIVDAFEAGRAAGLRSPPRRRRTGGQQGLLQGLAPPRRRPLGRLSHLHQRRRRHQVPQATARTCRSWSRPTAWPPARGSSSAPAATRPSRAVEQIARAKGLWPRRRPAGDRGAARRPRGQRAGDHRRPDDRHASAGPGPQGGLRRRHRSEHRRHGGLLPGAAGRRRNAALDRGAHPGADGPRHEAGPPAVPRRALRRA